MSGQQNSDEFEPNEEPEEPIAAPGPGSPVGGTLGEGSEAGQLEDTPTIGGGDQETGQTQHDAPPDDVGVPEDVPRD
jgi:hypothetical protein